MGKKIISINEGKLSEFKLHSIWLRERLNGSEFVDQIIYNVYMNQAS